MVNNKQVMCFVFRHDNFEGVELHCVWRWSKVTTEGDPEHFFSASTQVAASNEEEGATEREVPTLEGFEYDVQRLCAEGYDVDDDNEPAPENRPTNNDEPGAGVHYGEWGFSGICQRCSQHLGSEQPCLKSVTNEIVMNGLYVLTMFLMFVPKTFFEDVVQVETNKQIEGPPLTFGEFLQFIGIWLYMSTTAGFKQKDWFSPKKVDRWEGAPCRFNDIMSGKRFEAIIAALTFTASPAPPFHDKFHEIRDLVKAWNENMRNSFSSARGLHSWLFASYWPRH